MYKLFRRNWFVLSLVVIAVGTVQAQTTFEGKLDGRLHVDPNDLGLAIFDEGTASDAKRLGALVEPGDKIFIGELSLPKHAVLRFQSAIVRSPNGNDVLYVDANRDGRFEPTERIPFSPLGPDADTRLKVGAAFAVTLPSGPYKICPMEVRLPKDPEWIKVGPKQLGVPYTSFAFVQGYVRLPTRSMLMRFEYSFANKGIDLSGDTVEQADLNGDGRLDETPGNPEFFRGRGSAPVFQVDNLTVRTAWVDTSKNNFALESMPASAYQRIDLSLGATIPDFVFTDFNGVRQHLSEVKGKYRLLDFWATWCRPCVANLPYQEKAYADFHTRGFEILGMNGDEDTNEPKKLLREKGAAWPQARFNKELFEDKFNIAQWPTLLLIDERGRIVSTGEAQRLPLDGENLEKSLTTLMGNVH